MRVPKYQAWQKYHKEMFEVAAISFVSAVSSGFVVKKDPSGHNVETWTFDEIELREFTGLHDKHGKEIFEGDIVKFTNHLNGQELLRQCKWDIKYPSFVFCRLDQQSNEDIGGWKFLHYLESTTGAMEIIGNIYETPELLPVEKA
jgi:uncharacterized phage protein (TIGR01671 family)